MRLEPTYQFPRYPQIINTLNASKTAILSRWWLKSKNLEALWECYRYATIYGAFLLTATICRS